MFALMPPNPNQQVRDMFAGMAAGRGMGINDGLARSQVGPPAAVGQIQMALRDMGRANAGQGQTQYNLARGQMLNNLGNQQLAMNRSSASFGQSNLLQLLAPFLTQLSNPG
jgi:hypothetical protein